MPRASSSNLPPLKIEAVGSATSKSWIVLTSDKLMNKDTQTHANIVKLRHPRTRQAALYIFSADNTDVGEVIVFEPNKGSWFVNNSVKGDGKLHMITPMDALYLALPYFIDAKKENKTLLLEDLFLDEEYPETYRISACVNSQNLHFIADKKGTSDLNAWSYNEAKTLNWLKLKTENVASALQEKKVTVDGSAVSNTYVVSSKSKSISDSDAYISYACGLVSEYLTDELAKKLRNHMNILEEEKHKRKSSSNNGTGKRPKLDGAIAGIGMPGAYEPIRTPAKKATPKGPTAKEKNQLKAAAGSKTITSFFKKK